MSDRISRRDLLGLGSAAATGAAAALGCGCALLPRGAGAPTTHPCDHPHCRWFRRVGGEGRCGLPARLEGGKP